MVLVFFFFNDTATTEIYTLSLHDALPILVILNVPVDRGERAVQVVVDPDGTVPEDDETNNIRDRKSTRLNSSHANISYAVFCLKKKKINLHAQTFSYLKTYTQLCIAPV